MTQSGLDTALQYIEYIELKNTFKRFSYVFCSTKYNNLM